MSSNNIKEQVESLALKKVISYLNSNPDKSPMFMQYYKNQPFNNNHLRPCPLLDNPEKLESMIVNSGANSIEMLHPEDVHDLCGKCKSTSENWAITADRL